MSLKAMIFIDGSWLFHNHKAIVAEDADGTNEVDYRKIPHLLSEVIGDRLDLDIDIVKTCYFGLAAENKPGYNPAKQNAFYEYLSHRCFFDTEINTSDFSRKNGSRLDEHSVEIALASAMMHYATLPGVMDIAILIGGNINYTPLLKRVRTWGKRVQLVSIENMETRAVTSDELLRDHTLFDFPPIYLDNHADELRRSKQENLRTCSECGQEEKTYWEGDSFCCSECRNKKRDQTRICDNCGKKEKTTWSKSYFYCIDCRRKHRTQNKISYDTRPKESDGEKSVEGPESETDMEYASLDEFDPLIS